MKKGDVVGGRLVPAHQNAPEGFIQLWVRSTTQRRAVEPEQMPVASRAFHWQPVRST